MLGIIYCLLAILIGKEVAGMFFVSENRNKSTRTNQFWILASGALGTGLLIFGWITYMISWAASALGAEKPLIYGNLAVMAGAAVFLALLYGRRYRKENSILSEYEQALIHDKKQFRKELILLVILAVFLCFLHKRRCPLFRLYGLWRLCTAYSDDEVLLSWKQFSNAVSTFWRSGCKISFYVSVSCRKSGIPWTAAGFCL